MALVQLDVDTEVDASRMGTHAYQPCLLQRADLEQVLRHHVQCMSPESLQTAANVFWGSLLDLTTIRCA